MHDLNELFWNALVNVNNASYPPTNIIQEDNDFVVEFGVSGFTEAELFVEYDGRTLEVSGKKESTDTKRKYIQQGLAQRSFKNTIAVRGAFDIGDVFLENGILSIHLIDKTERVKPKIEIRNPVKRLTAK